MNDRFLRACRRQAVDRPPLWIMRQAGRYLPEYRELRARTEFLDLCRTPELAAEASLQPLRRFPLDAAIVFSDILLPLERLGFPVRFAPGPVWSRPFAGEADLTALTARPVAEAAACTGEAVALLRRELADRVPVIGFAGAPFTLAAYWVEGGAKPGFGAVKELMFREPALLARLLEALADVMADYLDMQLRAGAQAVQIFDTWAGILSPADYRAVALPPLRRLIARLDRGDAPVVYFAAAAHHLLDDAAGCGADVLGICWRTPMDEARRRFGARLAIQGNLDPHALLAPLPEVRARARAVLDAAGEAPGHVMNLGHGILPGTPLAAVEALVETVAARSGSPA
ncbi:MAG TPA: uroporphyrinogen decarboxylase [Candidatus Eisenbacteria bacterium]|nr:uroporphyrinogen decarboxylase [Candidatus Eisenbacteria bacterium]